MVIAGRFSNFHVNVGALLSEVSVHPVVWPKGRRSWSLVSPAALVGFILDTSVFGPSVFVESYWVQLLESSQFLETRTKLIVIDD